MCPPLLLAAVPAVLGALSTAGTALAGAGAAAGAAAGVGGISASTLGLATAGLGAASTVAGYFGQQSAAKANTTAANLDYANKMSAFGQQNVQLSQQHSEDVLSGAVKQAQDFGRISASAASLGLGASTLAPWLASTSSADARQVGIEDLNTNAKRQEIGSESYGAALARRSQINSVPKPTGLSLALGLGKDALEGASVFSQAGGKFNTGAGSPT